MNQQKPVTPAERAEDALMQALHAINEAGLNIDRIGGELGFDGGIAISKAQQAIEEALEVLESYQGTIHTIASAPVIAKAA